LEAILKNSIVSARKRLTLVALSLFLLCSTAALHAQAGAKLQGTVLDAQGNAIAKAEITVKNEATGAVRTTHADGSGSYVLSGLTPGNYTVEVAASGFGTLDKTGVALAADQTLDQPLRLSVSSVAEQVTVNAGIESIASESAPSGGFVEERSAQSIVSNTYIENFTSPIADFGEIVQIVPGTFTTSANGVGLGQSKTYFRGFQDGDYNIDFDGIPFYDTNSPTHHSWAFFPSQWVGGVDFDRSPGTASTIGPTPFGGSIHLLSKPLVGEQDARVTASYGTWNTKLYDGAYNSGSFGLFGSPKKSNLFVDVHHMTSDGYQSFNYNLRNAGSLLYQYQFSPRTVLTGFAGVVQLNSNGPNISSTRCMLYGAPTDGSYSCAAPTVSVKGTATPVTANGLLPFTGAGLKFLLTNNADPASWFDQQYNRYQVPTDFEYVSLKTEFNKGWMLEVKPYTYNYDNGELYSNATPMTEITAAAAAANPSLVPGSILVGGKAYYDGVGIAPCDVQVVKKGIAALPCGIDKYNSYRKFGETAMVSQISRLGTLRAGMWYEWANTNRHQYPSDPLNNWADQPLPKFNESFWTNSYQPYAEYEFHVTPKLNLTPGVKFAAYTIDVLHHADDGATVGTLTCPNNLAACSATVSNSGNFKAWLPSLDLNYRLQPNLSVYVQGATGSIVPPSSVYDYNQTAASASAAVPQLVTAPKQQRSTTYQFGTVYKGDRLTLDADAYRIRFQNSYSSTVDNITGDVDQGDTIYFLQPSSVTEGVEFETTAVLKRGLNLYLNGTRDSAYYSGSLNAGTQSTPYLEKAPGGLWVASTPTDTEQEGLTYQGRGLDLGIFNHRIGAERVDNGQYHNQAIIPTFSTMNSYINYTIRNRSIFDGTKVRLDATNLLDSHNIQSNSLAGAAQTLTIPGTTFTDQFNTAGPTPVSGADTPAPMAGRSFAVTVTFGLAPRER
jgi:iron complex outermembrane receptor protein